MARTAFVLSLVFSLFLAPLLAAQGPPSISGVVVDEGDAVLVGARIYLIGNGRILRATRTDGAGEFSIAGVPAATYQISVEMADFRTATLGVTVPSDAARSLRAVLRTGGFADRVVVTARRDDARATDTPQKIETVDARDIARSVSSDLTDVLKKNSSVDVIQFTGALSGIGIRGFRPQFSGINKRSLLLVDGRPSGVTNLATLRLDNVARVEVLKGAASSIYGSSAMGGVVNVISRESRSKMSGAARVGGGSFSMSDLAGRIGGSITPRVDFDVSSTALNQRDDIRMGDGNTRPATSFKMYEGALRVGVDLNGQWRLNVRGQGYRGRDIMTPGDLASGLNSQGSKDLEQSSQEVRLLGNMAAHRVTLVGYHAAEAGHTSNVTSFNPADVPFLPFLAFESELSWSGVQLRDAWTMSPTSSIVLGFDYENVKSVGRNFTRTGAASAPFSANANKRTAGFYAEHTLKLAGSGTVVSLGGRVDRLTTETVDTPLKTNFVPSEAVFNVFNPSAGVSQSLGAGARLHAAIGRAFIPAEASQLTGFTTSVLGARTQITQGNPDLGPERSTSFDVGLEWTSDTTRLDVTLFRTVVKDRFISNVVIENPPPPAPIIVSVRNGLDAHLSGLELEANHQLVPGVRIFANTNHYFSRKERLLSGAEQDALNVPQHSYRFGVDLDLGPVGARLAMRHVRGAKDNDFNLPGFPIINRDNITVADASVTYRLRGPHAVALEVNNLFDNYYYEVLGYPLQGASFKVSYRLGL